MWRSFDIIRGYRPLMVLPVICWIAFALTSTIVVGAGALVFKVPLHTANLAPSHPKMSLDAARQLAVSAMDYLLGDPEMAKGTNPTTEDQRAATEHVWLMLLILYVANNCVLVYFNVAFAHIALDRLSGGTSTLVDGLSAAWNRKFAILKWALLASSIGLLLRMVRDGSEMGRWIAGILGYFWNLGTYFVMPLLALKNFSPGEALHASADLIKEKWGETIVAGFSFSLLFAFLAIPGLAIFLIAGLAGQPLGLAATAAIVYGLLIAVFVFSAQQVFTAALFLYATEGRIPKGFGQVHMKSAWEGLPALPPGLAP